MPRLTDVLLVKKPNRYVKFTNYNKASAYKNVLPEALNDKVASGLGKTRDEGPEDIIKSCDGEKGRSVKKLRFAAVPCLQEMSLMLVCFNKHDFQQGQCAKELQAFYNCQKEVEISAKKKADEEAKGLFTKSFGKLPSNRVNELLRNFPQPVDRKRR